MVLMSSTDSTLDLSVEDRCTLVQLAHASIESGLLGNKLRLDLSQYSTTLQRPGASFVTLRVLEELRGCIGSIEARRVLVMDVVKNAHAAAFSDPRFDALTSKEFEDLNVHISVLSDPQGLTFTSEDDLIRQLRPGVDGVILEEGSCRATYLPAVWKALPDARQFLQQLKLKAGLPADYWSERIQVRRYTTESFS